MKFATQNRMTEFSLASDKRYEDPFQQVSVDVVFTAPDESERVVPAFWAGEDIWRVRYASSLVGRHHYRTICSDTGNPGLRGQQGEVEVRPYDGSNLLFLHGPLQVSKDRRYLEHQDGTPFFWLGDTWWHGLTERFRWPEDFHVLTADRVAKGFTVVQIVAGLLPDLVQSRFWEKWAGNEGGWAWEKAFTRINPYFFDAADLRIGHLVQSGLVPCLVGAWGYYLKFTGLENMKKHWRYLVARYGAYPVVWCLAGEVNMPVYDSTRPEEDRQELKAEWTEVARHLREVDPYRHPITAHPSHPDTREMLEDETLVDVDMLQTGHRYWDMEQTVRWVMECVAKKPRYPVLIGEVCYEGEYGANWQDIQRFHFWTSLLSGSAGHTYGAHGIWQFNTRTEMFVGDTRIYGDDVSWDEAMKLPGSRQMGIAKSLLQRYPWWQFEPRHESNWDESERLSPFAAGIPGRVWVMYLASEAIDRKFWGLVGKSIAIEPDAQYRAFLFNPRDGREIDLGQVQPDEQGKWAVPRKLTTEDMILVLEAHDLR